VGGVSHTSCHGRGARGRSTGSLLAANEAVAGAGATLGWKVGVPVGGGLGLADGMNSNTVFGASLGVSGSGCPLNNSRPGRPTAVSARSLITECLTGSGTSMGILSDPN
jgi:hypothetical protein